jgi:hypothetical protein
MTNYNFFETISQELDNNINDYLSDTERDEIKTFEDLTDILQDVAFFDVEIIYYYKAMKFLAEHDPSLCESMELANRYDFKTHQINSELLASLLASEMLIDKYNALGDKINEHFNN